MSREGASTRNSKPRLRPHKVWDFANPLPWFIRRQNNSRASSTAYEEKTPSWLFAVFTLSVYEAARLASFKDSSSDLAFRDWQLASQDQNPGRRAPQVGEVGE